MGLKASDKRTDLLVLRVSRNEHTRIREIVKSAEITSEAQLVRSAVNAWAKRNGHEAPFREDGE